MLSSVYLDALIEDITEAKGDPSKGEWVEELRAIGEHRTGCCPLCVQEGKRQGEYTGMLAERAQNIRWLEENSQKFPDFKYAIKMIEV